VLQCVAVCCSVLQSVDTSQGTAVFLQCVAVCCSVLQSAAVCCSLQTLVRALQFFGSVLQCTPSCRHSPKVNLLHKIDTELSFEKRQSVSMANKSKKG